MTSWIFTLHAVENLLGFWNERGEIVIGICGGHNDHRLAVYVLQLHQAALPAGRKRYSLALYTEENDAGIVATYTPVLFGNGRDLYVDLGPREGRAAGVTHHLEDEPAVGLNHAL